MTTPRDEASRVSTSSARSTTSRAPREGPSSQAPAFRWPSSWSRRASGSSIRRRRSGEGGVRNQERSVSKDAFGLQGQSAEVPLRPLGCLLLGLAEHEPHKGGVEEGVHHGAENQPQGSTLA